MGEAPPAPSRPTATAVPQPQVQPLPNEADLPKGELTVRPQTKPPTVAPPKVAVDELPQPYTPDAPRNNQPPLNNAPQLPKLPNLPNGLPEAIVGSTAVAIGVKAKNMLSGGKIPSFTPVRLKNVTLNAEMKAEIKKLADYRQEKGFPAAAKVDTAGTIASTTIDGQTFFGHSTVNERALLGKDNQELRRGLLKDLQDAGLLQNDLQYKDAFKVGFLTHAETEAILEARQKLGSLKDKELVIYVDREPCDRCFNHLPKVAELYGIKSITIISSNPQQQDQIVTITKGGVR